MSAFVLTTVGLAVLAVLLQSIVTRRIFDIAAESTDRAKASLHACRPLEANRPNDQKAEERAIESYLRYREDRRPEVLSKKAAEHLDAARQWHLAYSKAVNQHNVMIDDEFLSVLECGVFGRDDKFGFGKYQVVQHDDALKSRYQIESSL